MKKYYLGNWLRGWYKGEFETPEEAWNWLSKRFMWGFPTDSFTDDGKIGGRHVVMYVRDTNKFGFEQNLVMKRDVVYDFELTDELKEEINKQVQVATEITIEP